jgi:hypothetical protein
MIFLVGKFEKNKLSLFGSLRRIIFALFFIFETVSYCVAQAGLELMILLP